MPWMLRPAEVRHAASAVMHASPQVGSWRGGRRGRARVVVVVAARARAVRRVERCMVLVVWVGRDDGGWGWWRWRAGGVGWRVGRGGWGGGGKRFLRGIWKGIYRVLEGGRNSVKSLEMGPLMPKWYMDFGGRSSHTARSCEEPWKLRQTLRSRM